MELTEVRRNYDRAAKYYDRATDLVFAKLLGLAGYRARTIELLGDVQGATVLDVGCGTGRNFPLLVPRVGAAGRVLGVDYSEGMLEKAQERIRSEGWRNVELIRDDAAELAGVSGPVDAVTSAWCYGIVHDLDAALNRAVDLLRPGGRIAIMDFGRARPDRGPLKWLYPVYSALLRWTGIDTAEDLDDSRLRSRWERGREVLGARLEDLHEEHYLSGAGLILAGRKSGAA